MGRLGVEDQTQFQPPSPQTNAPPPLDQTAFQPPSQGYPVPESTPFQPPPQGYPNHHDNPLSPPPDGYMADNDLNANKNQSIHSYPSEQPPSSPMHASHQQPALYPPQQPPAAYPPQAQPATYQPQPSSVVANGTNYNPQMYSYTPNHTFQPQVVNYGVAAGYQQQVTTGTGTPNWYQPPMAMTTQEWSTGLLDCFDDPENAIMTFCVPCVTFGQIAEIVDNGQTSCATSGLIYSLILAFIGIPCIMSCSYRTKIRSRYNLLETPAPDWVIHFFCEYCALCQEYRELKNRGMDPALGWQGNLSRQQQMANCAIMTPPVNQRMMG